MMMMMMMMMTTIQVVAGEVRVRVRGLSGAVSAAGYRLSLTVEVSFCPPPGLKPVDIGLGLR